MADINQVVSLGIGTPAGIPEFLTFGLQIGAVVGTAADRIYTPGAETRVFVPEAETRVFVPPAETRTYTV